MYYTVHNSMRSYFIGFAFCPSRVSGSSCLRFWRWCFSSRHGRAHDRLHPVHRSTRASAGNYRYHLLGGHWDYRPESLDGPGAWVPVTLIPPLIPILPIILPTAIAVLIYAMARIIGGLTEAATESMTVMTGALFEMFSALFPQ